MRTAKNKITVKHTTVFTVISIFLCGFLGNLPADDTKSIPQEQQQRFDVLKSQGAEASITILPTTFGTKANARIGMVVGIMLEGCGMKNLEFEDLGFSPQEPNFEAVVSEFGNFVAQKKLQTDYIFYSQFLVDQRSISEIWGIVANHLGEIVWSDRQTQDDPAFKTAEAPPQDPMTSCLFLTDRFRSQLGLDPMDENAPDGKIAKLMNADSNLPSEEERALMEKRADKFKKELKESKMVIYPALIVENQISIECASNLADLLNKRTLCLASVSDKSPVLKFDKTKQGQNTMLWSIARSFQDQVREDKPSADYALYAHYGFNSERDPKAFFVNFVVCDKNGDWVITDLANSHHEDFQKMDWQSLADCDQFVVNRLEEYLK